MKLPSRKTCTLLLAVTLLFGLLVQFAMANNLLFVREVVVESDKVYAPLNVVLLTNVREREFGPQNELLFSEVAKLSPDLIAITGDMLSETQAPLTDERENYLYNFSARANAIAPSYFIDGFGDHAYAEQVKDALTTNGVTALEDNIVIDGVGGFTFSIGGIDDSAAAPLDFSGLPGFHLLLANTPGPFQDRYAQTGADLVLSGPPGQNVSGGLHQYGEMDMVVGKNLDNSGAASARFFSRPEITLVRLVPAGSGQKLAE